MGIRIVPITVIINLNLPNENIFLLLQLILLPDLMLGARNFTPDLKEQIAAAVASLHRGDIVAFPTETVYGLGANISHPQAIQKIFAIKNRPPDHPLIVHFARLAELEFWAEDVPEAAHILARHFWPGPLTLILPKSKHIPYSVTGGQDTVGLRIPRHPIALKLLEELGSHKAIAAPSANRFGFVSPTSAEHVRKEFGNHIDIILDGGSCEVGLESTIVSCIDEEIAILRPGGIQISSIENILKQKVLVQSYGSSIRTSGSLASHYATATPLEVCHGESLFLRLTTLQQQEIRTAIIIRSAHKDFIQNTKHKFHYVLMANDPAEFGRNLYATLRKLDNGDFQKILVEAPPDNPEWLAISDRLRRASHSFHQ